MRHFPANRNEVAAGQYVILSRNVERREHERLLHDTVLNTLTALARVSPADTLDGGGVAGMVSRARQDVTLIEAALSDPDPDGSAAADGDLVRDVRGVAAAMSARGLLVHVEVAGRPGPVGLRAAARGPGRDTGRGARLRREERAGRRNPGRDHRGRGGPGLDIAPPRLHLATDDAPDRPALSEQERRALQLYATGMPMKSVARRMAISEEAVKQYVQRVRLKYARAGRSAPTKLELYHRAVEDGHIPPSP